MTQQRTILLRTAAFLLISTALLSIAGIASAATAKDPDAAAQRALRQINAAQQLNIGQNKASNQLFQAVQEKARAVKTSETKAELAAAAKTLLTNTLDAVIGSIQTLQTKIQQQRGIAESDRASLLAELQPDLAWLAAQRARTATLTHAQAKQQANDIRARWPAIRADLKRVTGELRAARIRYLSAAMEGYAGNVERSIAAHASAGKNTAKLQSLLAAYNDSVGTAAAQYNLALPVFRQIRDADGMQELFRQGTAFLDTAQQAIKDGQAVLAAIVAEMRDLQKK